MTDVITPTEIDTYSELDTIVADAVLTHNGLIDTSAEIAGIVGDETGTGVLVFGSSPTLTTPAISGAVSFPDNVRQTFNPGSTNAGFNVGAQAGDPSTPSDGDLWYDSTANELTARINAQTIAFSTSSGTGQNRTFRLLPEYEGGVLEPDGTNNSGALTSGMETHGNYKYNYYEFSASSVTMQDYDLYLKWQVPSDFTGYQTAANDALLVDLATETTVTTNNEVKVTSQEDGVVTTSADNDVGASSVAADWHTKQEGNALINFDATDTVLAGLVAGDVLVIHITLKSASNNYARVGAVTLNWKN
jgi:hypothetical protein